ncbi:ATP-dependent RNA helicase DEAH12, chloroplastic, partial [Lamellibrachia satsuma]
MSFWKRFLPKRFCRPAEPVSVAVEVVEGACLLHTNCGAVPSMRAATTDPSSPGEDDVPYTGHTPGACTTPHDVPYTGHTPGACTTPHDVPYTVRTPGACTIPHDVPYTVRTPGACTTPHDVPYTVHTSVACTTPHDVSYTVHTPVACSTPGQGNPLSVQSAESPSFHSCEQLSDQIQEGRTIKASHNASHNAVAESEIDGNGCAEEPDKSATLLGGLSKCVLPETCMGRTNGDLQQDMMCGDAPGTVAPLWYPEYKLSSTCDESDLLPGCGVLSTTQVRGKEDRKMNISMDNISQMMNAQFGNASSTKSIGHPNITVQEDPERRTVEETPKFVSENTPDELCRSTQNPKQNTLAKCSGARPKSGGKLHTFPILENPKESKESIRKKIYKTQHSKLSQRNASAINRRIQGEADTVDIHGTARLQDRRQRHETLQSENNNEIGLIDRFPSSQQCHGIAAQFVHRNRRGLVFAASQANRECRQRSTDWDQVTVLTIPNVARTSSGSQGNNLHVVTPKCQSSATAPRSTDWGQRASIAAALTATASGPSDATPNHNGGLITASSALDTRSNTANNGKTYNTDVKKKKRIRGRNKWSTKHNEANVKSDDSVVNIVSVSAIVDSDLDQNILLKKQRTLYKHEQKMKTLRDASDEQLATRQELRAQKVEFEVSTMRLLARLRVGDYDTTCNETVMQLRRRFGVECKRLETALPIYARRTDIVETVRGNAVCVVLGETGSGKSTQLPQYVYEEGAAPGGKIVCTQPRKVAAVSLATRVAHELATPLGGDLVGYHVGMQRKQSDDTALLYVTDHVLLNECLRDPLLSAYSCIIIDEAHERSIFTDLLLGMVKRCLTDRNDLRVIITSATIDPELFVHYFGGCPVLEVQGRTYPVGVHYEAGTDQPDSGGYLSRVFQKVKEIHTNELPGDVLVFVPSALDTEKGCEATRQLGDVVSLPLHGGLPPKEQQKVFDPEVNGYRKIVFATNCAETSVTVPGIRYVVDTGLAKERTYDTKLNVSSLKLSVISRSSAEQRKGRAGRTAPGTCYRLYSAECYNNMTPASTPEILRVHIGQALLKLMDIGVDDPASFDYVEPPPSAALEAAAVALESLGATTDGRINDIGRKLSRLNVHPRLGKVILLAIAAGIGYEGLVATALSTVGGYVFFRGVGDSEQQTADRNKFRICEESGDVLTFVSLYKQWTAQPERAKNRWCVENSVNAKFMRLARDSITETKRTLKRDLHVDVKQGPMKTDAVDQLVEILLECYADNLCFFSGHQRTGYWMATGAGTDRKTFHLHPSSALASLGAQPCWIIYENVMVTSRPYMTNVTAIENGLIERLVAKDRLSGVNVTALSRQQLRACPLPPVGLSVLRALTGRGLEHLKRLEKEMRRRCETEVLMLEASFSESRLIVYAMPHLEDAATAVITESIVNEKARLAAECSEVALGDGGGGVRVVLGRGGAVARLLMPDEYRTVVITDASDDAEVLDALRRIGPVLKYTKSNEKNRSRRWGEVTFNQPEHALRAVNDNNYVFSARPVGGSARSASNSTFTLKANWCRRPSRGFAFVTMTYPEDVSCVSGRNLLIRGRSIDVNVSRKNIMELYLNKLPLDVDNADILTALKRSVDDDHLSVSKVVIPRENVGATTPSELDLVKSNLSAAIKTHVSTGDYKLEMIPPREKDFDYNAWISFTNATDGMMALRALNGHVTIGSKPVTFTADLRTSLTVTRPVYDAIREELEQVIQLCRRDGSIVKVSNKTGPDAYIVVVRIHTDSLLGLQMAADAVR